MQIENNKQICVFYACVCVCVYKEILHTCIYFWISVWVSEILASAFRFYYEWDQQIF